MDRIPCTCSQREKLCPACYAHGAKGTFRIEHYLTSSSEDWRVALRHLILSWQKRHNQPQWFPDLQKLEKAFYPDLPSRNALRRIFGSSSLAIYRWLRTEGLVSENRYYEMAGPALAMLHDAEFLDWLAWAGRRWQARHRRIDDLPTSARWGEYASEFVTWRTLRTKLGTPSQIYKVFYDRGVISSPTYHRLATTAQMRVHYGMPRLLATQEAPNESATY